MVVQEGYGRWELFRQKGLDLYAAHRNNALKRWPFTPWPSRF